MTRLFEHIVHPHKPRNINAVAAQEQSGFNDRLAVAITKSFGSMFAFYTLIAWMLIWMALASAGIWLFALDKFPFTFLLFLSNLVQLWALPVLAVGQNVLNRHAELQAEEQFGTTQKTYHDTEQIMLHLQAQDAELIKQSEQQEQVCKMIGNLNAVVLNIQSQVKELPPVIDMVKGRELVDAIRTDLMAVHSYVYHRDAAEPQARLMLVWNTLSELALLLGSKREEENLE